jgi:hypothetical protein
MAQVTAATALFAGITTRLMNVFGKTKDQSDFANRGYYPNLRYHDIMPGSNGNYTAVSGWDVVTGMGSFGIYPNLPTSTAISTAASTVPSTEASTEKSTEARTEASTESSTETSIEAASTAASTASTKTITTIIANLKTKGLFIF